MLGWLETAREQTAQRMDGGDEEPASDAEEDHAEEALSRATALGKGRARRRLLDARVVEVPMAYTSTLVMLSSLKPFLCIASQKHQGC